GGSFGQSPARFGNMTMMGITNVADDELASRFVSYWFNEGYAQWLSIEPEMQVPLRNGPADNPDQFKSLWYEFPVAGQEETLTELFGEEITNRLANGVADAPRWGIDTGYGPLMGNIYESNLVAIVLQEMLSGYFTSNQAGIEAYQRVVDLVPNYAYQIDLSELTEEEESQE
ncbi:MAG: hypothetical protein AAF633_26530, partial [Chloroflexota bacterium]